MYLCTLCLVLYLSGLFFAAVLRLCVFSVSSLFHSLCHCGRCFQSLQSQFFTFLFPFQCPYSHDLVFIAFFLLFFLQMKTCLCVYGSNPSAVPVQGPINQAVKFNDRFLSESRSPLPAPLFFKVTLLHCSLFDL